MTRSGRPTRTGKRTPIGTRSKLRAEQKEGYVRRFVNDVDGGERIKMFLEAGYKIVSDGSDPADKNVGESHNQGSVVGKHVGAGTRAILMEIPEEFHREDALAKEERVKATEAMMMDKDGGGSLADEKGVYGDGIKLSHAGRPKIQAN